MVKKPMSLILRVILKAYSTEIISQDYLNAYAKDGLKWWFNSKNQEGFHPDNHHFWLMGNGDQDNTTKIYNAVKKLKTLNF